MKAIGEEEDESEIALLLCESTKRGVRDGTLRGRGVEAGGPPLCVGHCTGDNMPDEGL